MFKLTEENVALIQSHVAKYPSGCSQSALLPALDIAQRQNNGWLSMECIAAVAEVLSLNILKVYEVVSFYSMFHLKPVGRYHVQVCGTVPCWLRGAEIVRDACAKLLDIHVKEITEDGMFSLDEVECLGACVNGPVVQINDCYFEDVDDQSVVTLLEQCRVEGLPPPHSLIGRRASEPLSIHKGQGDSSLPKEGGHKNASPSK